MQENERVTPLTLRKKFALEVWRCQENIMQSEHPLRQLFWECTLRCNLNCRHCGSDCRSNARQKDMPKEDFMRVLDSIAAKIDPHKVFVNVTGGEPLMRTDLEECCAEIYAKGFPWCLVTNALYLTPQRFVKLLKAGMHSMTISIDGLEELHNWMRGNAKSFQRVDNALNMLAVTPELTFDVVTCVNRRNYVQLDAIKAYLIKKGVKRWRVFTVFPVGRASADPDMRLSDVEFRGVLDFIRQSQKEGQIRTEYGCEGFLGNYEGEVRQHFFTCQAGVSIGSVLADGSISGCTSIRADYHQGNIYKDDFMDVWEKSFHPYRDRRWMKKDNCEECNYWRYCHGNGMHLRDSEGKLLLCHLKRLQH